MVVVGLGSRASTLALSCPLVARDRPCSPPPSHGPRLCNLGSPLAMARNLMSTPTPAPASTPAAHAPDSPRETDSPPPQGIQGDLEMELLDLATSLYNLGTTVVNDLTKEKDKPGGVTGKPVGIRVYVSFSLLIGIHLFSPVYICIMSPTMLSNIFPKQLFRPPRSIRPVFHAVDCPVRRRRSRACSNDVIRRLAALEDMAQAIETMVPMQVLVDIDNSRNPVTLTKDRLERAATENQFMNGKIHAIDVRHRWLFCRPCAWCAPRVD